ncbi:MAG: hypothetical protein H6722_22500 [Sandaracinus sp.]|nr:hypothetical protein [Myxococcales bacterium]MCB9615217.1 hypothetical protein [Sandaracinus sp.]
MHRLAVLAFLPSLALAQPPAPQVSFQDSRAQRDAERCLERLAAVPTLPPPAQVQRAEAAERPCAGPTRREPGASAQALVTYQAAMLRFARANAEAGADAHAALDALDRQVRALPMQISTNWTSEADDTRVDREVRVLLDAARALAPSVRATPPPALDALRATLRPEAASAERELARVEERLRDHGVVHALVNTIVVLDARLRAGALLLPDPAIAEAAERTSRWLASHGREAAQAIRGEAVAAAARERHLPAPAARDAALERRMRATFESQGWNEPVRALVITDASWAVERDVAGRPVARRRSAAIGVQLADGSCRLYDFVFLEPHAGGSWGTLRRSSHASVAIACENLPR